VKATPAAVAACLDMLGAGSWSWDRVITRRANSEIHLVRCDTRPAVIKACFQPGSRTPDPVAAEREYAALAQVKHAASSMSLGRQIAPLPLVLCREHAAFGMSWIPGRTATEEALSASTDTRRAAAIGEAVGAWLRTLHSLHRLADRPNDFESKLPHVEQRLADNAPADRLVRTAADALASCARAAAGISMPASWVHGDMKTDNVIVDGRDVFGIDLHLIHENTVAYDLAPFLNHLRLLRWTLRGALQQHKLGIVAASFLQAYSPDTPRWTLPIAWLRTYLLIQVAAPVKATGSLRADAARWIARRELTYAVHELQAAAEPRSTG
jgi:aminoglycoside phosphotransferase (APT) family kinase protein